MCRNIKQLRGSDAMLDTALKQGEIEAAALQYVRKVTGFRAPSRANRAAFDQAVQEVASATQRVLDALAQPVVEN